MVCFHRTRILKNRHPDAEFSFSDKWFTISATANNFSANTSQRAPDQFVETIMKFHQKLLRERKLGKFQLKYIANIDQTLLPFVLDGNKPYDTISAEEACNHSQNI